MTWIQIFQHAIALSSAAAAAAAGAGAGAGAELDIRPIKGPVEIDSGWSGWLWSPALVFLLALAYFLWKSRKRKPKPAESRPPVPAHLEARRQLKAALKLLNQPGPFCVKVSNAIRTYMESRFELHAPERTTEEFLQELQSSDRLTPDQKQRLGDFLSGCDLVKFSRYEPEEKELRALYATAYRFVEETAFTPNAPSETPNRVRPEADPPRTAGYATTQKK